MRAGQFPAPSVLIFDMDGVLVDSEPLHKRAKEEAFRQFGIVLPESVYDSYKGRPDETMLPAILGEHGGSERLTELSKLKRKFYESIEHELQAVPGAVDFVVWAKSRYRVALATSATPRNRDVALKMLGLGDCFEVIVDHGRHRSSEARSGCLSDGHERPRCAGGRVLDHRGFTEWNCGGKGGRLCDCRDYNDI